MKSQLPLHFIRLIPLALLLCLSSALGLNLEVEKGKLTFCLSSPGFGPMAHLGGMNRLRCFLFA
ncbi:hypothetical protein IE53DRAFT_385398 [Violaceomyces palustris]|uniref:Uncharacterized protein n=1 Tax=Violaceomyces palustris TaxID=1673888 RepID=A0ACD0P263_9BASI|nr:hypothetical protein IE53DRAFT_385398 [Violaceomyces palustris]